MPALPLPMRLVALLSALVCLCACGGSSGGADPLSIARGSTLQAILDRGVLKVGMEVQFPPFEYKDAKGEVVGFDVDLAKELAAALGVKLELVDMRFDGIIPALETGKLDLAISGISATLERARKIAFSAPYHLTELCLLVHKDSKLTSWRELDSEAITLVVKTGTTGQTTAERLFPKAKKKILDQEAACAMEVVQGKADAFVYDKTTLIRHQEQHAETTRLLPEPFSREPYAIALRQGEPDLARFIDQLLSTMVLDGRMEKLRRTHLERP